VVSAGNLRVVFQPIVRLSTNEVFAYECLVRCIAPGLESPLTLFEQASSIGFVGRLGRAIREVAQPLCEGIPIFFNLHPDELSSRWLVRPDDPIYSHDAAVYLEITESVPLAHFDLCRNVLREVRSRRDAHLVVDDLGAGYSNLKYIADLEPSIVKLDMKLVRGIDRAPRVEKLVRSIVRLCDDLGAGVVAEGIEEEAELEVLRGCDVQFGQGFLLARPGFPLPIRDRLERTSGKGTAAWQRPVPAQRTRQR
jgi:EAL domain-containing protein (putative c-di-GMP-specific phosphodiesterase class I)